MTAVTATIDPAKGAGHALIRVAGGARASGHGFRIFRSSEWAGFNLGTTGWQGSEETLQPDATRVEGDDLVLCVGPGVCNVLEPDNYFFAMPALGLDTSVSWPDIEPLHAGSTTIFPKASVFEPPAIARPPPVHTAPDPLRPVPVDRPPAIKPPPIHPVDPLPGLPGPQSDAPSSRLPMLLGLLAVLIVVGGVSVAWWIWSRPPVAPPVPAPGPVAGAITAPPPPPPAPPAADLDTMSVQGVVATNDPATMLNQAKKRLAARPQDALLLLEAAGEDRHNGPALTLLGQLYDPNKPRQGGIPADARQAAKYYREADRNNDHTAAADREALHRSLLQKRDAGDLTSKLIEQDFWP